MLRSNVICACLLGCLFLSSCATRFYTAEFLVPSERFVPAAVARVGLVNRAAAIESQILVEGTVADETDSVLHATAVKTLDFFEELNNSLRRYDLVRIPNTAVPHGQEEFWAPPISDERLESLIKDYDLDAIISLEGAVLDLGGNMVTIYSPTPGMRVLYKAGWKIYDKAAGKLGDVYERTYTQTYNPGSALEQDAQLQTNLLWELINAAAENAAEDYFQRISPHWQTDYRRYYISGNETLEEAAAIVERSGDWERVASAWSSMADNADSKIAYRARFNMALAAEMLGNPDLALIWLEKAIAKKNTKIARQYRQKLQEQATIHRLLEHQLGL